MKTFLLIILSANIFAAEGIISLGLDATDIIVNLERSAKIIATDSLSLNKYKTITAKKLTKLNNEAIKEINPELILLGYNYASKENQNLLEKANIRYHILKKHHSIAEFEKDLRKCGELLDNFNKSVDLETDFNTKFAELEFIKIMNSIKSNAIYVKYKDNKLWAAPKNSIQSKLIEKTGVKNSSILKNEWGEITIEQLQKTDHILIGSDNYEDLKKANNEISEFFKKKKEKGRIITTDYNFNSYCIDTPDVLLRFINKAKIM